MSSAERIARTTRIAYNSCRNRHCPKCQGAKARQWLAEREAALLPVPYYHVVFTLPAAIGAIAFHNKAVVYDLLFKTAAETLTDHRRRTEASGRALGLIAVLHTWGSALTHHPHVHVIVPGGGLSPDGSRWIACKSGFFLPVRVLSRLFRRLFLEGVATLRQDWPPRVLRRPTLCSPTRAPSMPSSRERAGPSGSSTPSDPSPDRRPFSPTSRVTPIALRSPIPGSSPSTTRASPSNGRTTGSKAVTGSRP